MIKHINLVFFIFFVFSTIIKTDFFDNSQLHFEPAQISQKKFLVNFLIESNSIYTTRVVDKKIAEEFLDISKTTFEHGIVETLKLGTEIVGFFALKIDPEQRESCKLTHLFVKLGLENTGIGTMLFERAIFYTKKMGCNRLWLISHPDAEGFYIKKGAKIIGSTTDFPKNLLNPPALLPIFEYCLKN